MPFQLSGGTCVLLILSVFISSTSVIWAASDLTVPHATNTLKTTTATKMNQSFVPGEILVKFKPSVSQERIDAILKESGVELIAVIQGIGVHHVRIVGKQSVEAVVKHLSTCQEIEYAEPNFRFQNQ